MIMSLAPPWFWILDNKAVRALKLWYVGRLWPEFTESDLLRCLATDVFKLYERDFYLHISQFNSYTDCLCYIELTG